MLCTVCLVTDPPLPLELNLTEIGGVRDRQIGTLVVRDPQSKVTVFVMVEADPCPTVQWSFKGANISNGDDFTINDPCTGTPSPFTFSLTVRNLISKRSGAYSATFTNLAGSANSPPLYITIPGIVRIHVLWLCSVDLSSQCQVPVLWPMYPWLC